MNKLSDEEFMKSLQAAEDRIKSKDQIVVLQQTAALVQVEKKMYITNALLKWMNPKNGDGPVEITKILADGFQREDLVFVCSSLTETDFTVLLRFRNSSVRLAESHDELKLNMSTILAFSRQSVLSRFEIIQINLTDSDFHQHYRALIDEPRNFGAIVTLPNEHKGFRRDIAQHHPPVLNSHFGSLAVSHPSAKHALVDSTFFNHFTQRLFATFYRPPYSEDSPAEAISKCSEAATYVSRSLSLWVGVNVSLEAQFLSGSDANN